MVGQCNLHQAKVHGQQIHLSAPGLLKRQTHRSFHLGEVASGRLHQLLKLGALEDFDQGVASGFKTLPALIQGQFPQGGRFGVVDDVHCAHIRGHIRPNHVHGAFRHQFLEPLAAAFRTPGSWPRFL
jgi:hypothetical protein